MNTTATCLQYHGYGRRTGLKIRSSEGGVDSSPTFGTSNSRPPIHAVVPSARSEARKPSVDPTGQGQMIVTLRFGQNTTCAARL